MSKSLKNCKDCRYPGSFFEKGDGRCKACWGSGLDGFKQIIDVGGELITGKQAKKKDLQCDICSGTGQCQTCGGTGESYENFPDDNKSSAGFHGEKVKNSSAKSTYNYKSNDYGSDLNHNYSKTNTKNKSNNGCLLLIAFVLLLFFLGYKSISNAIQNRINSKQQIQPPIEVVYDKTGFVNKKEIKNARIYNNYDSHKWSFIKGRSKVHVVSYYPKFRRYEIVFNKRRWFIKKSDITFDDILGVYNGNIYREFINKGSISLTKMNKKKIRAFLTELKKYSDKIEVISYDYLNNDAAAKHRNNQIRLMAGVEGLLNTIVYKERLWKRDKKNQRWSNLTIIRTLK